MISRQRGRYYASENILQTTIFDDEITTVQRNEDAELIMTLPHCASKVHHPQRFTSLIQRFTYDLLHARTPDYGQLITST